jgi:hypothetical protein
VTRCKKSGDSQNNGKKTVDKPDYAAARLVQTPHPKFSFSPYGSFSIPLRQLSLLTLREKVPRQGRMRGPRKEAEHLLRLSVLPKPPDE